MCGHIGSAAAWRGDGGPTAVEIVFEDGLVIDVRDGYEQPSPRPYVVGP